MGGFGGGKIQNQLIHGQISSGHFSYVQEDYDDVDDDVDDDVVVVVVVLVL